jgi:DtxR family Mn-dependent transcriptional regulator
MHRHRPVSETHEMYLKTLYRVRGEHQVARVRDLAQGLGVSPATVSTVLKKLERLRLVDHERYGRVALTPAGSRVAECVVRRFETLRAVLVEVLGVDPDVAAVDACMMEHAVSPLTVRRMRSLLEAVRRGAARVPRRLARPGRGDACAECEVLGACQAAVADLS